MHRCHLPAAPCRAACAGLTRVSRCALPPRLPPQLLADCYYVDGKRNRTYRDAVNAVFGRRGDIILGW